MVHTDLQDTETTLLADEDKAVLTPTPKDDVELKKQDSHSYGSFVAYCFCVNYILGVGVLGVPYGFYKGGVIAGPIILFIVTIFAMMSATWIIETLARAQALFSAENPDIIDDDVIISEQGENEPLTESILNSKRFRITQRKFEMNDLCRKFLGIPGKIIYEICICLYLYGALWSYTSVFSESMASHVPFPLPSKGWYTCNVYSDHSYECNSLYLIYVGVFACFVVPLTCLNLTEQKPLQVVLTVFRYVALGLMIIITLINMGSDPYSRYPENPHTAMEPNPPYISPTKLIEFAGFSVLMPICIYSQILHHSIPGLNQPVRDKKRLNVIFGSTFITTFSFYVVLGVVLAVYYGPNIQPTCSLNFGFWRAGTPFGLEKPTWVLAIVLVIILFPAIDVISAFPLNGITLGNNMHVAVFGTKPHLMEKRWVQVIFRVVAAVPPIIGAMFVRDLSKILQYVGLVGFVITFIIPPILNIVSKRKCEQRFGESKTYWTVPIVTSTPACIIVALFAASSILFCIVMNIYEAIHPST